MELVDKFCYLGDMLSVDGDADAAVETIIRIGWNKYRQLVPLITNEDISLIVRGRISCSSKSRFGFNLLGFTFLVPADPGGRGHIPDQQ